MNPLTHGYCISDSGVGMRKPTRAKPEMLETSPQPEVGIFFVYKDRLHIEGTLVSEAQPYGDFMGHANGHPAFWGHLGRIGVVPRDVQYDEVARGRIGYDIKERIFRAFMDKCI